MLSTIRAKLRKEYLMRIKKMSLEDIKLNTWRLQGMTIGENVHIYSDIYSKEPYMISIGDGTTISGDVTLVTHDNSISKYLPEFTDTFGRITIGKNCFIGMGSMIMGGSHWLMIPLWRQVRWLQDPAMSRAVCWVEILPGSLAVWKI